MRRSAIQCLLDDYAGTTLAALLDRELLIELDTELQRVGTAQGPLPDALIPRGMPAEHWWWRYPEDHWFPKPYRVLAALIDGTDP